MEKTAAIKKLLNKHQNIALYGFYSVIVTVIDYLVVLVLKNYINLIGANTIAVVIGFVVHYLLSAQKIFGADRKSKVSFLVYLLTFFIGLFCANVIIWFSNDILFQNKYNDYFIPFTISKGFSIVIPFFIMYFMRKYIYGKLSVNKEKKTNG